jgi:hypothetical protein
MITAYSRIADNFHHFTLHPADPDVFAWLALHCRGECSVIPRPPLVAFVVLYRTRDAVNFMLRYGGE